MGWRGLGGGCPASKDPIEGRVRRLIVELLLERLRHLCDAGLGLYAPVRVHQG